MLGMISICYSCGGQEAHIRVVVTHVVYEDILEQWADISGKFVSFEAREDNVTEGDLQVTILREDIVSMYFLAKAEG